MKPPVYDTEKYQLKLWENQYGEQILCVREKSTRKFWWHHSDCGWEKVYDSFSDILLSDEEIDFIVNSFMST